MSDNPRPVTLRRRLRGVPPGRGSTSRGRSSRTIAGKHCEQGDVIVAGRPAARRSSRSATSSPPRSPAPTATRWRRTTTRCPARRSCSSATASARVVVRRETLDDLVRWTSSQADAGETDADGMQWTSVCGSGSSGAATSGAALVRLVARARRPDRGARRACRIEVARVAVRDLAQGPRRDARRPSVLHRRRRRAWSTDPDVDVVVEVIGGIEPARALIVDALDGGQAGRHREQGADRARTAASCSRPPRAPASTSCSRRRSPAASRCIRPLRESLAGDRIRRVIGIVNGTTNYILTRMTEDGASFADALAEAQALGYAEPDPTADVEGFDAAAKAAIIASIAFGARVVAGDVYREGITEHHRRRHRVGARRSATS